MYKGFYVKKNEPHLSEDSMQDPCISLSIHKSSFRYVEHRKRKGEGERVKKNVKKERLLLKIGE